MTECHVHWRSFYSDSTLKPTPFYYSAVKPDGHLSRQLFQMRRLDFPCKRFSTPSSRGSTQKWLYRSLKNYLWPRKFQPHPLPLIWKDHTVVQVATHQKATKNIGLRAQKKVLELTNKNRTQSVTKSRHFHGTRGRLPIIANQEPFPER